jgi:multidrug efflux pump subunit AcrA (membrane-fusion protein)
LLIERDDARSKRDFARADVSSARIDETQAQIDKIDALLAKAEVRAPIAGQVSRGDLEPFVGARVDPTQPLFELVTHEQVLVLEVDERDVARVTARTADEPGTHGWFAARATPGVRHEIEVVRVNPVAEAIEGANVYKVEAVFTAGATGLSPGATGRARLEDGMTTALISTFGPIVDQLRLRLWW